MIDSYIFRKKRFIWICKKKKKHGKGGKRRRKLTDTVIQQTIEIPDISIICIATNASEIIQIDLLFFSNRQRGDEKIK